MRFCSPILGITAWLLLGASLQAQETNLADTRRPPGRLFAGEPRGPYRTGTIEEFWIDEARDDDSTLDPADKRRLMVQIWYPAAFAGDPPRAPYILSRKLYPSGENSAWMDELANARTESVLNARVEQRGAPFPVLVYNPGGGHPPFTGTAQTEFLASHGYVVLAIGHSDITSIARFPDGHPYEPDAPSFWNAEPTDERASEVEKLKAMMSHAAKVMMPRHVKDISFGLDRLQAMNLDPRSRFHKRLDLGNVGALGWSLGGISAMQAARDEPRVLAGVNLDGWLYSDLPDTGTRRPVMQVHHGTDPAIQIRKRPPAERELFLFAESLYWRQYANTTADWFDVTIAATDHGHYSDVNLFQPDESSMMPPRQAHEIINRVLLEFFGRYVRGSGDTPLLDRAEEYPQVTLWRSADLHPTPR